jgi:hypothetical protein
LDSNFVNIELDDGDSRDIHFENIRFLPPDYPLVGQFINFQADAQGGLVG